MNSVDHAILNLELGKGVITFLTKKHKGPFTFAIQAAKNAHKSNDIQQDTLRNKDSKF